MYNTRSENRNENDRSRIEKKRVPTDEEYWKNWPGNCMYNEDLKWGCSYAIQYLQKIAPQYKASGRKGLVIFDIDDTIVFGDPAEVIGVKEMELGRHKGQEVFILPVNQSVVKVANVARSLGFIIICLTARPKESQLASATNLNMFNVPYDKLIMNEKDQDPFFKIHVRKKLSEIEGQDVILTIGDQVFDVFLPGPTSAAIKLPSPESKCSYAYIPS